MTELQSAQVKRLLTNLVVIGAPLVAGLEAVRGQLPPWLALIVTAASVALKQYQSHLDLQAPPLGPASTRDGK
jgi:hypothetical protein